MLKKIQEVTVSPGIVAKYYLGDKNRNIKLSIIVEENRKVKHNISIMETAYEDLNEANELLDIAEKIKDDMLFSFNLALKYLK